MWAVSCSSPSRSTSGRKAQKAAETEVATAEVAAIEAEQASDEGFVKASNVLCDQTVENRDAALALISERAVEAGIAEDSAALYAAFLKREAEGTTGMVEGFAIPHAKSDTVKTAQVMVLKSSEGIASWETMDESPVTCAIALLVPESEAGTSHLQILSKVATALTDEAFRAAVKSTDDPLRSPSSSTSASRKQLSCLPGGALSHRRATCTIWGRFWRSFLCGASSPRGFPAETPAFERRISFKHPKTFPKTYRYVLGSPDSCGWAPLVPSFSISRRLCGDSRQLREREHLDLHSHPQSGHRLQHLLRWPAAQYGHAYARCRVHSQRQGAERLLHAQSLRR
ncbi:MAG: PTS sugar transporter subunit IIA [Collinsella sp.]